MKHVTARSVHLLVRRRNRSLRNHQVSLVCAVQRQLHNNYIVVEIHAVKLTVHVRKSGGVRVYDPAEVLSVVFFPCADVVEITAFREKRYKLWSVLCSGLG